MGRGPQTRVRGTLIFNPQKIESEGLGFSNWEHWFVQNFWLWTNVITAKLNLENSYLHKRLWCCQSRCWISRTWDCTMMWARILALCTGYGLSTAVPMDRSSAGDADKSAKYYVFNLYQTVKNQSIHNQLSSKQLEVGLSFKLLEIYQTRTFETLAMWFSHAKDSWFCSDNYHHCTYWQDLRFFTI